MENKSVIITMMSNYVIKMESNEYMKYRFGKEDLLWLPKDYPELFRGDFLLIAEDRKNGLSGDIGLFEAVRRPSLEEKSGLYAVRIEYRGPGHIPDKHAHFGTCPENVPDIH